MLNIHILNVGHGDSAIVEYKKGNKSFFGVVDSNRQGNSLPKALNKLQDLGAKELSFVCLTHPHSDHYSGLFQIFQEFSGRIKSFYTFPLGEVITNRKRLKTYAEKYQKIRDSQDDLGVRQGINEFLQILKFASENFLPDSWIECAGEYSRIAPPDFDGVEISTIMPPRKAKGEYFERIKGPETYIAESIKDNDLSLAIWIVYADNRILLGGDATFENWINHKRWQQRAKMSFATSVVKLPHHGSKIDCNPTVLELLFNKVDERYAVISANGRSHPDRGVLEWLETNNINPYCTNLVPQCGANVQRLLSLPGIDPLLMRWLQEVSEDVDVVQACQGDITIIMDHHGVKVVPEFDHLCPYRESYKRLFQ